MRRFLAIILLFTCVCASASPDNSDPYSLQHYDNRNGLSNSSINHLFIDASNMLWVATWDGLNLYNGSAFHVFNYSKESDIRSIGSNVIQRVAEDKRGNIWITTIEGISRYAKATGQFYHYFYTQYRQSRVSENEYALAVDTAGVVYCFSKKTGLSRYNEAADRFVSCTPQPVPGGAVTSLFFDDANRLWLLHASGELNVLSGDRLARIPGFVPVKEVSQLYKVGSSVFFTTHDNRLFRIAARSLQPGYIMQLPYSLAAIGIYKEHYLLAWAGRGCGIYNKEFKADDFLGQQAGQLENVHLTSFTTCSEDILWCGTDGSGIIKVYPKTKPFGTVSVSDNGIPYNRSVRAFCGINGDLWVGTKGSGIIVMKNFSTDRGLSAKQFITSPASLDNNSVYALLRGADELVYIGTDGKGIGVYDERAQQFYKWNDIRHSAGTPEFGSVYTIRQDRDRSLWIGTSSYGLVHLTIERDKDGLALRFLERFTFTDDDRGPANDIIYAIEDAGNDQLWVGCRYGGLSLLDKRTRRFKTFKAFAYNGSLSNNDVLSLFRDNSNRLWIGTSYGLNWLDEGELTSQYPQFKKLTTEEGLPNNTIHAIGQDSSGQVWISSNKGLACINAQGKISYYQQVDGLQSNEFSDGAVWKDAQGYLYFGGIYGFNHFLPRNIGRSSWQPNLLISGLLIGDEKSTAEGYQVLTAAASDPLSYSVQRSANYFELDMKALSYLNAEKCEYAYFLEGYDKTWKFTGTNGRISYSNLLPGHYTLRIKWSNGEGAWSEEKTVFGLEVKQYFWLRWYALLFYGLVAAAVIYIIYRYRKNKEAIRHQLEVEHLLREKDETAHRSRIGFFTNIAHELQTPLTLIMGSAERFREKNTKGSPKENSYFLSLIHQQASKLTYLVHQLLDFRKAEEGFAAGHYAFLNVSELLQNLAEPFTPLAEKNKTEYEIRIEGNITGWTDTDKLEKIVYNLLSNAFKHTVSSEQISFVAAQHPQTGALEIAVTNPCNPVSRAELEQLFDQFYTRTQSGTGTEKFGTGIGLAFTQQLVTLLHGTISCHYENDRITFKVSLPLQQPMLAAVPAQVSQTGHQPSSLYTTITAAPGPVTIIPPQESNKHAVIEQLQGNDRKSILLVEDDEHIRFLLKDILQDEYIIYEATDGLEAISLIEKLVPDLVICDVMMPNMNGLELCNRVKNASATCHVPFIILSARGSDDHHMEGYEVGADAYIAKPFQAAHLKTRVNKLIEYRQKLLSIFNQPDDPARIIAHADLPPDDKVFLTKLAAVIEDNLADPELNAVFLEKTFNLSKMQLYRKLKTMTGMTPGEFIKHVRLKHAAGLLLTTQLSVTEIFYRIGFNNQSYFFREFKKKYQSAPNEYRNMKSA